MLISSKFFRTSDVHCLERVIVGAAPTLDNLNHTIDLATGAVLVLISCNRISGSACPLINMSRPAGVVAALEDVR